MNEMNKLKDKAKREQAQAILTELRIACACLSNAVSRQGLDVSQIEAKIVEAKKLIQEAMRL